MSENDSVSLIIHGRVQGVFYRSETRKKALQLDLKGWVRNNSDGTVECVAEGKKSQLEQFIKWCNEGSDSARVEKVDVKWLPYQGEFESFSIKY